LADLEDQLKQQGPVAEDVAGINKMLEEFAEFQKQLDSEEVNVNACLKKGEVILRFCHPSSLHTVRHQVAIVKKRWTDVSGWARLRKTRLDDGIRELIEEEKVAQVLMEWITRTEVLLEDREKLPLPQEYNLLVQLLNEHQSTLSESEKKQVDYGKITKKAKRKPLTHADRHSQPRSKGGDVKPMREFANPMIAHLSKRWQKLWLVLLERRRRIEEKLEDIRIQKASAEFNWEEWRDRYNTWLYDSKSRVLDMWRNNDNDKDNKLTRDQFIHGISDTSFPSERWEIELVFDKHKRGLLITYADFMDSLKGRKRKPDKPKTESEEIHDIIGAEVAKCCCVHKFTMSKVSEGKYRFGDAQKLRLVRILRSMVMVRVGGGWVTLVEFLSKNDPCRAAGATNYELRENFVMPENASQGMQAFKSKSLEKGRRTSPASASDSGTPSVSREGSSSGIPVPRVKREKSGIRRSRDEVDHGHGHCHGHPHKQSLPTPSIQRKKSDMSDREGKTIPTYKRESYKGKSSGYGVTHPIVRKKKDSAPDTQTIKSPTHTTASKNENEKSGDVYSRLYGTPKSAKRSDSVKPSHTHSADSSMRRSASLKTPHSERSSSLKPTGAEKESIPGASPASRRSTLKPTGSVKESIPGASPTTKRSSLAKSTTSSEISPTKRASTLPLPGKSTTPTPPGKSTGGGVFERLSSQSTATRRASSIKETGSSPKKTATPKRTPSTKK